MKKQSIIAIVTVLVIISAIIGWLVMSDYSLFGADNTQGRASENEIKAYAEVIGAESIGGSRENTPEVAYQLFSGGTKTVYVLGHQYIYAQDSLPQTITVRGQSITIEKIYEPPRNPNSKVLPQPGTFQLWAETHTDEVLAINQHGSGKQIKVQLANCDEFVDSALELCDDQFPSIVNDCPYYKNYFFWYIEEADIDPASKEWNFIKVSLGLYQENFCQNIMEF